MNKRLLIASVCFSCLAPSLAHALDEKEIMLRVITTVDLCYNAGDADKIKMMAFGAGIDITNLDAQQKTIVASTKRLYQKLPPDLKKKVCDTAKKNLKDFP